MAVTIDATAGGASSNSFCTLAELETYLLTKLHLSTAVSGATSDTKNRALVSFTRILDQQVEWDGWPATNTQALQWPRTGILDALYNSIDNTVIPQRLKDALCEGAIALIDDDLTESSSSDGISRVKVGSIDLSFKSIGPPRKPIPDSVMEMISLWGRRKYVNSSQIPLVRC